ncbi:MAG: trypsin-like serine protease, partial [Roseobacter sp.]
MIKNFGQTKRSALLRTAAAGAIATLALATPAQAIVPNDNFTPDDIVDTDGGVNGVGMFFRNDGFVCSGTLINPRTVLFAAHCVNSNPESDFADGNINSAFSFDVNALPGFQNWIGNGFASNPD